MQQQHSGNGDNVGNDKIDRQTNMGKRSTYIENQIIYGEKRILRALTKPPFMTEVFLGREDDLATIENKLFSGDNLLLLVNGQGGVGKTSIAAKYYNNYNHYYAHTAWVLSEKSIANALITHLAMPLGIQFDNQWTEAQRLDEILRGMAALEKPCLLVIDNANEVDDLEKNYQNLRRCPNFHLLLTSRILEFALAATYQIQGLPEAEALALFKKYYPKLQADEEPIFKQIRTAVGGNTLVVELLAKNLFLFNRLKQHYTLTDLLTDLQTKGLLALSKTQRVQVDYQSKNSLRTEKPEDIIAAMYDLGELSRDEVALLSVFAVLPAESIGFDNLESLLIKVESEDVKTFRQLIALEKDNPEHLKTILTQAGIDIVQFQALKENLPEDNALEMLEQNLLALAQKGWIEYDEPTTSFKCSPVVQEITKKKNPILRGDCQTLINSLIEKLDYEGSHLTGSTYEEAIKFARYAETVIATFVEADVDLAMLSERIGSFYSSTGDLNKALFFYLKEKHLFKELHEKNPNEADFKNGLAISYSKLGSTHAALGNLDKALQFYEDETVLFEQLYESYPSNVGFKNGLAISYSKLGETHAALGNLDKALQFYEQRSELGKQLYESYPSNVGFKNGLAISYSQLGRFYADKKKDKVKARLYFEKCQALLDELVKSFPLYVEFKNNLEWVQRKLVEIATPPSVLDLDETGESAKQVAAYIQAVEAAQTDAERATPQYQLVTLYEKLLKTDKGNPQDSAYLSTAYGILAWYQLFAQDFAAAEQSAKRGIELDATQDWINTNLASALLYQGKWAAAKSLYLSLKDKPYDTVTFKEAFLGDLDALEKEGIKHEDVAKIRDLFKN